MVRQGSIEGWADPTTDGVQSLRNSLAEFSRELMGLTGEIREGQDFQLVNQRLASLGDRLLRFISERLNHSERDRFDQARGHVLWKDPSGNIRRAINAKAVYLTALMETLVHDPESILREVQTRRPAPGGDQPVRTGIRNDTDPRDSQVLLARLRRLSRASS